MPTDELLARLPPALAAHARLGGACELCFVVRVRLQDGGRNSLEVHVRVPGQPWQHLRTYRKGRIPMVLLAGAKALGWPPTRSFTAKGGAPVELPP